MLKKILAVLATLAVGTGLAVAAIAAPASAHHNTISVTSVTCSPDHTYQVVWSVTNSEAGLSEIITASSDEWLVPKETQFAPAETKTFIENYDYVPTQEKVLSLDALWENGFTNANQGTLSPSQFPTDCADAPDVWADCTVASSHTGSPLAIGDAITVVVTIAGQQKSVTTRVVAGSGFNNLSMQPDGQAAYPLSKTDVLNGYLWFDYPSSLGVSVFDVVSVTSPGGTISSGFSCGEVQPVSVSAAPTATPPTCDADGSLVITPQAHVVFSGGANGAGPGTYTITAAAESSDYELTGPSSWEVTVLPQLEGWECEQQAVPVEPEVTVITSCDEYGSIVFADTPGVDYALIEGDGQEGPYTVRATPQAGYHFGTSPSDAQTVYYTGDLGFYLPCPPPPPSVTPAPPTATPQTCDLVDGGVTSGSIHIPVTENVSYYLDGVLVDGPADVPVEPGLHFVVAVADQGYVIDGDDQFTLNVEAALDCATGITIPVPPTAEPEVCDTQDGSSVNGSIILTHTEHVTYSIDGTVIDTSAPGQTVLSYPAGTYTVTAVADEGYLLVGDSSWEITVDEYPFECEISLVPVKTSASASNETCVSAASTGVPSGTGTITVAMAPGVSYEIDGVPVTSRVTAVTPGAHLVQAFALPGYTLDGLSEWNFTIADAICDSLAFTGAAPGGLVAAAVTLLGVGGLLILRRRRQIGRPSRAA